MTPSVLDGTADERQMLNYNNRTIEPIISAIVDAMRRSFLSKTARTQGQTVMFFRDHFKLVPVSDIANMADVFTRNEILSSNEIRQIIGMKPSDDPKADELHNSNMPYPEEEVPMEEYPPEESMVEDPAMTDIPPEESGVSEPAVAAEADTGLADAPVSEYMDEEEETVGLADTPVSEYMDDEEEEISIADISVSKLTKDLKKRR
jgi:hypothetical protein